MQNQLGKARFLLVVLGMLAFLLALWGGLIRLGWRLPLIRPTLPLAHGPLMVCGFLGTLIGVERAVALGLNWPYAVPLLTAAGVLSLLAGLAAPPLMTLASLGLVVVCAVIVGRQPVLATAIMALGALLWLVGNSLWLAGWPLYHVTPWWSGFLVLTIAGERLELSRLLRLSLTSRLAFLLAVSMFLAGVVLASMYFDVGSRIAGVGILSLSWWLLHHDIARHTVWQTGLTRFIAVCLLSGYVWLGVGGILSWRFAGVFAGPYYDAMLHTVFVGFVLALIFGHAPIIFPAVLGGAVSYHPTFYLPLFLLHVSLLLRLTGDLSGWFPGRQWGGMLNAVAVLVFLGTFASVMLRGRTMPIPESMAPSRNPKSP